MAAKEIAPFALTDNKNAHKGRMIKSLAEMNLLCPTVPKEYGGLGLDLFTTGLVVEEIAAASPGLAAMVAATLHAAEPIILAGNEQQKNEFLSLLTGKKDGLAGFALTEPSGGSDLNDINCEARWEQNGYRLNGCKDYVINADAFKFMSVVAATDLIIKKLGSNISRTREQLPILFRGVI